jgi:hypothetical protein
MIMSNLRDKMIDIGKEIRTQDNRITDSPIFVVEQKVRDYGFSEDYVEDFEWINDEGETVSEDDVNDILEEHNKDVEEEEMVEFVDLDDYNCEEFNLRKVYYKDRWQFVTACFTEKGCEEYLKINEHNLKEARIYAFGSYRNDEFRSVREYLLKLDRDSNSGTFFEK